MLLFLIACRNPDGPEPRIKSVEASQPWHENELRVDVALSAPASVAVACTLRSDPAEVHLVEDSAETDTHSLRIAGLLGASDYDCVVAAVEPAGKKPVDLSVRTGPVRKSFVEVEATDYGGAGSEYILFNQSTDCSFERQLLDVVDREGALRWWYAPPSDAGPSVEFRYHGNNQFEWGGGWKPNSLGRPRQLDLFDGQTYDSAEALPDVETSAFHHDGKQLPDGKLLTLEEERVSDADGDFEGFRVRRLDPATGLVDFDYHSQRAFDEGHLIKDRDYDPWHANWVDVVDETLYISMCIPSLVAAIDVTSGDWLWSFGMLGEFALSDLAGEPIEDGFTRCQHGLEYTSDNRMLVYDNGRERTSSRVSEYQLDPAHKTATMLWSWTEDDWWETVMGDADYMPGGRILIDEGHSECLSTNKGDRTSIVEIDPVSGKKLWELRFLELQMSAYRADWADSCALFANAAYCPEVGERLDALAQLLK